MGAGYNPEGLPGAIPAPEMQKPRPVAERKARHAREGAKSQAEQEPGLAEDEPGLNWLFVDLNSYFASVEQQVQPHLRGRPIVVVPAMVDTTCCIAASYEAKAYGIRTGTIVGEAKRLCPDLVLVEGRHELYTEIHHRIVKAVDSYLPVTAVLSIDEMACRLVGPQRSLPAAIELGHKIKAHIRKQVGVMLRSSIGIATNRYLAKIASDMEKPDGLVALPLDILPDALRQLTLRDLPGIGRRMEKHLNEQGIRTLDDLLALDFDQAGAVWGSVLGQRLWHWLRGEDFDAAETEHMKSLSHQHVLAPEMRNPEKAWAVAHKLLHKAAMRLRNNDLWVGEIGLVVGIVPKDRNLPVSSFGAPARGWKGKVRLSECQDNQTLIAALRGLWESRPKGGEYDQPYFIGVHLNELVPDALHTLSLFDATEENQQRTRLLETMDALNQKYGLTTLAPASMLAAYRAAPTRIAFHSIPEVF